MATCDNWINVMDGVRVQPPACEGDKCGNEGAVPFFLSFVFLVSIVMLNLFTAVIIENFEKQYEQEEWKLTGESLQQFVDLWSEYDNGSGARRAGPHCAAAAPAAGLHVAGAGARGCKQAAALGSCAGHVTWGANSPLCALRRPCPSSPATGSIEPRQLESLLLRVPPPLGLGPSASGPDVLRFVYSLDIPLLNFRVPFHKTLYELVARCSAARIPEGAQPRASDRHLPALRATSCAPQN